MITEEVYGLLESRGGLERREVVLTKESEASSSKKSSSGGGDESGVRTFVFVSPGFESKERLQVKTLQSVQCTLCTLQCGTVSH